MPILNRQVGASTDDARIGIAGVFNLTDVRNSLGYFSPVSYHLNGRFLNVTIPNGATINSAVLEAYCAVGAAASLSYTMQCEASDNANTLSTEAEYTGRSFTAGTAGSLVTTLVINTWYTIGDFVSELQAVVNRPGWSSGNAILCRAVGLATSTNNVFRGYDGDSTKGVRITIDYSDPVTDQGDRSFVGVSDVGNGLGL